MDQTIVTLIVINLILNFLQVLDHFLSKIKSSKCWGASLEMNNSKTDTKELDQTEILKQLKALTDKKQDTALASLSPPWACDPVNKL